LDFLALFLLKSWIIRFEMIQNLSPGKRRLRTIRRAILFTLACSLLMGGAWAFWRYHGPAPEREIFRGITYGCERMPDTAESGGLFHWIRADLNVPGVSLYVTPLNPDAQANGWEYKLRHVSTAVSDEHLAAAVNGTLFDSDSSFIRLPGDYARSIETAVADHQVNHVHKHTYLLWWDDDNVGHLEPTKPPSESVLSRAKWGIGGQQPVLLPGSIPTGEAADARTFIAGNPEKKLIWIACFDKASYRFAAGLLKERGATVATAVDGGTSTAMVIGSDAKDVRAGTVTGNWRPVATQFGFRAHPLTTR
jgi:hypothetical protein